MNNLNKEQKLFCFKHGVNPESDQVSAETVQDLLEFEREYIAAATKKSNRFVLKFTVLLILFLTGLMFVMQGTRDSSVKYMNGVPYRLSVDGQNYLRVK